MKSINKKFLNEYKSLYLDVFNNQAIYNVVIEISNHLKKVKKNNKKVIIVGNGGSSSIASHVSVDLIKVVGIKSVNFNEHNLITCLTNDYGQERWVQKALEMYLEKKDLVILISSSGKSPNMINAAKFVKKHKNYLITCTGFSNNNPLSKYGDVSMWINSKSYNVVENMHQVLLLMAADLALGKIYYKAN